MSSLSLAAHIVWFARVTLTVVLLVVIVRRQLYKQFLLFAVHSAWIAVAGVTLIAMNYASSVSGYQYFAGVAVSNGLEAALAFGIIYEIFAQRVHHYPLVKDMGSFAFRASTLIFVAIAVGLAWLVPGHGPSQLASAYLILQRTARTLQCGQLVFLLLFCGYFRLSWRTRSFGIALGLGILCSTSLAINAIHSQIAPGRMWSLSENMLGLVNESTYLVAVIVWLFYCLAPEQASRPTDPPKDDPPINASLSEHDLEPWNRELGRLLQP
jgi:hypothetical protein